MKKVLKWVAIILGSALALVILFVIGLAIYAQFSFKRIYADYPLYPISADTSPEGMARGQYLMESVTLCYEACHSEFGEPYAGGYEVINEGPINAVFAPSNITQDIDTGIGSWSDAEIARAIREGLDKDGVELVVMPSYSYRALSDSDMAAIIAYLRNIDPVTNSVPDFEGNIVAKIMTTLGLFGPNPAGDPIVSEQLTPAQGTIANGEYLSYIGDCRACHQQNLAGGPLPMAPPDSLPSANLTTAGELANWTVEEFIKAVNEGKHPSGRLLTGDMPRYKMSNEDLADLFEYLQSIPSANNK